MRGLIEIEVGTSALAEFIREKIKDQRICSTQEFAVPGLDGVWVLERFLVESVLFVPAPAETRWLRLPLPPEIGGPNPLAAVLPFQVWVAVRSRVRLARPDALTAAGRDPLPAGTNQTADQTLEAVFRVTANAAGSAVAICFDFLGFRTAGSGSFDLRSLPGFTPPRVCVDVGLEALSGLLGSIPPVVNVGMVRLVGAAASLIVRLEVDDFDLANVRLDPDFEVANQQIRSYRAWAAEVEASWTSFYRTPPASRRGTAHCAVFVSASLLEEGMTRVVSSAVRGADRFILRPGGRITTSWEPVSWGGRPHLRCEIPGRALRVCECGWSSDVDTNVVLTVDLAQPFDGRVRADLRLDWYPNVWSVACCTLQAILLWPFLGSYLVGENRIGVPLFVGGLAGGPLAILAGAVVAGFTEGPGTLAIPRFTPARPGEQHDYVADIPVRAPATPTTPSIEVTGLVGTPEGLTVLTQFGMSRDRRAAELAVGPVPQMASWSDGGTCGPSIDSGVFRTEIGLDLHNRGEAPLFICARVIDDPDGLYGRNLRLPGSLAAGGSGRLTATTPRGILDASLAASGATSAYPFRVLIASNGGSRILTIAGANPLDTATEENFRRAREGHCAERASRAFLGDGRIRIIDLLSDPPDIAVQTNIYQLLFSRLPDDAQFGLEHAERGLLAEAVAGPGGGLSLSTAVWDQAEHDNLSVVRLSGAIDAGTATLNVRRLAMIRQARVPLPGPVLGSLQLSSIRGRTILAVLAGGEVHVVDITDAGAPTFVSRRAAPDVGSVALWGDQLLVGGSSGLVSTAFGGDPWPLPGTLAGAPIQALAAGDRLWVLTAAGLFALDEKLRVVAQTELANQKSLALHGAGVATAGGGRVLVVALGDASIQGQTDQLEVLAEAELSDGAVVNVGGANSGPGVYVEDGEGAALIDVVSKPGTVLSRYRELPWFSRAAMHASLLALPLGDGAAVGLFELSAVAER